MNETLLTVDDLAIEFETEGGTVRAVDGVSFDVQSGEIVGLVGESGAGKSVTGRSLIRLLDPAGEVVDGRVEFRGRTIIDAKNPDAEVSDRTLRSDIRGREIALIFQDPMESLNPTFTVGQQLNEIITTNRDVSKQEAREIGVEMLFEVGIPDPEARYDEYPHEFSGGMRQRVLIAMALACEPSLIVADEPTTAVDVTVEGQILDMVDDLQDEYDTSFIWITHDMGVIAELCDRVNVMYLGEIVEQAPIRELFHDPQHPYTEGLLASIPKPDRDVERLQPIVGDMPSPRNPPSGCRFHTRCPYAREVCTEEYPELRLVEDGKQRPDPSNQRTAACFRNEGFEIGYDTSPPLDTEATRTYDELRGETGVENE